MTRDEKITRWMKKRKIFEFEIHGEAWFSDGILVSFDGWRDVQSYLFKFDKHGHISKVLGDDYIDRAIQREYARYQPLTNNTKTV